MAWHEWPLILFTVFAQTAVGAFLLLGALILSGKLCFGEQDRLMKGMFFLWVVMGLGFMASTMHLGSPMRAFNALNRVGSSWLSNEIFFGSLFFAAGGFYWLLETLDKGAEALRKVLLAAAMVLGVVFMYSMTKVYLVNTVPTWDTMYTPLSFVLTMLVAGMMFAHLLLTGAKHKLVGLDNALPIFGAMAVMATMLVTVSQLVDLNGVQSAITSAYDVVPDMAALQILRVGLLLTAVGIWFIPRLTGSRPTLPVMAMGFGLVMVSELISRGVFYGLHMTVGL